MLLKKKPIDQENYFNDYQPKIYNSNSEDMKEIVDESIDLIITSPPYGQIKDYNSEQQIGFGEDFSEYFSRLKNVWKECYRVLSPQRRLIINVGDQYLRAKDYGRYRILPIASKIIQDCIKLKFDFLGDIIWRKISTTNTTGGCSLMGSLFYPRNGMATFDYEHILIFKKVDGKEKPINRKRKELSKICMDEWKRWYVGHWKFPGVQQKDHIAMFPEELPYRLIRMFSFLNDIILDPFAGSGTTLKVAKALGRKSIGYEINPEYKNVIERKSEEHFNVKDFHTIAKKLYQKEKSDITFDFKFSTQKSILCFKNHLDHKIVADFMSNSLNTSEKNFFENLKGKLEENNIKNYLSKKPAWQDIDRYWIIINIGSKKKQIIDELQVKINDWVEGNIEIINFDDFIENF